MKTILIAAKSLGGGGSEVALIELLNQLDYSKYKVTLLLLDKDDEYKYKLDNSCNIEIKYISFTHDFYMKFVSMYDVIAKILKKLKINSIISYYDFFMKKVTTELDREYDLAIDFYGYGYFLTGYLAERISANKKATWLHDEKIPWISNVKRYLNKYDKVFGVSMSAVNEFNKLLPEYRDKSAVFYNVINIDKIKEKSTEKIKLCNDDELCFVTVGRLHNQKGYDIAIECAEMLMQKKIKFKWYAIGSGPDEKKLKRLVKQKSLENNFLFMGRMDNPYNYMKNCSLYIQPSRHEGYVITLVEARSLNIPILASDILANREQIIDGENGFLCKLEPKVMCEKIIEITKDTSSVEKVTRYLRKHPLDFKKELNKIDSMM